jgi:hypothetical protein
MIIFPTAFVFTQTPMGLIEEPAARLAGYGQECGLLRKSRRLGSDEARVAFVRAIDGQKPFRRAARRR